MNREFTIDMTKPREAAISTIEMFIHSLVDCRGKTGSPEELEWEIRVYEFMMKDPEERLKAYQNARFDGVEFNLNPRRKRDAVKLLGWDIP